MTAIEIIQIGWATTVQDAGRPGFAAIGVPPSGALDRRRHALVNRLLGNAEDAPVLETAGGLRVRATGPSVVATSTEAAARAVAPGDTVDVGPGAGQLWSYLAVRGGLVLEPVLGSVSQDMLSGLGPPALHDGDRLPIGPDPGTPIVIDQAPIQLEPPSVGVWPGPRLHWFVGDSWAHLQAAEWTVSSDVSRVGVRLDGPRLERAVTSELPSEGLVTGAVQVPPDGRPVVMLADHPTTGGYPVIAVVDPASLGALVQAAPGTRLHFAAVR